MNITIPVNDFQTPPVRPAKIEKAAKVIVLLLNGSENYIATDWMCAETKAMFGHMRGMNAPSRLFATRCVPITPNESFFTCDAERPLYDALSYLNLSETREIARIFRKAGYHVYYAQSWSFGHHRPIYISKLDKADMTAHNEECVEITNIDNIC